MTTRPEAPSFDLHLLALGRLCVTWATLDRHLIELISAYTGLSASKTACVVATSDNVAAKCEMLRLLATENAPTPEWQGHFINLVDIIRNNLAPLRNRFVHDYWTLSEGTLQRLENKARAERPQALQPRQLKFQKWHNHEPTEVDNLAVRVAAIILAARVAHKDLNDWSQGSSAAPSLPRMAALLAEVSDTGWNAKTVASKTTRKNARGRENKPVPSQ